MDQSIDNQRNALETHARALITSVIRPDTLYSKIMEFHFKYIPGICILIF